MGDLIDTTEMYLKTIFELIEDDVVPMRARIVERIGHSGPTVSQTISRMERDGLVCVGDDRKLNLTEEGADRATRVMRKHRLAERLLLDVIGLDWELVHDEACRWEHVMSDQVEKRLVAMLKCSKTDPYGNAVPGESQMVQSLIALAALRANVKKDECVRAKLARIGEPVQAEPTAMEAFAGMGLRPGSEVCLTFKSNAVEIGLPSESQENRANAVIPGWMESHLFLYEE